MPVAKVVDLSHHNTIAVDMLPLKNEGVLGVIHKCTQGHTIIDKTASARCFLAKQAGLMWGLYHYLEPQNIPAQAEWFYSHAVSIMDDHTLIAVDHEEAGTSLESLREFMALTEQKFGRDIVLYTGHTLKEQLKEPDQELNRRRLWLAQYGPKAELPKGFTAYWLWQYTDKGSYPGIGPKIDLNAFNGTDDQLRHEWSGKAGSVVQEPVPTVNKTIKIVVPKGMDVEVTYE